MQMTTVFMDSIYNLIFSSIIERSILGILLDPHRRILSHSLNLFL